MAIYFYLVSCKVNIVLYCIITASKAEFSSKTLTFKLSLDRIMINHDVKLSRSEVI